MPVDFAGPREYPSLLLRDRLNPITSELTFIELDHDAALAAFLEWREWIRSKAVITDKLLEAAKKPSPEGDLARMTVATERGVQQTRYVPRRIEGDLETVLRGLLPLANFAYRYAVIPTASGWTAFFDNGRRGPDLIGAAHTLARRTGARYLSINADPDEIDHRHRPTIWLGGGLAFELGGPNAGVVNDATDRRLLRAAVWDSGRWGWEELGDPLPFEQPEHYKARRKKDRLPLALIREYAAALGLQPFEDGFYSPKGWGTIVTREGWLPEKTRDFTLDEVQERIWTPSDQLTWPW
jgi:hypothetical protein